MSTFDENSFFNLNQLTIVTIKIILKRCDLSNKLKNRIITAFILIL